MNTVLKRKINLTNDGSKKPKVVTLQLRLELTIDDDDDGNGNGNGNVSVSSNDSALGTSIVATDLPAQVAAPPGNTGVPSNDAGSAPAVVSAPPVVTDAPAAADAAVQSAPANPDQTAAPLLMPAQDSHASLRKTLQDALSNFKKGLTGANKTSTDDEMDEDDDDQQNESMLSEPSTHDDDPRDNTVRTQDLEFDPEDTGDSDFWMPLFVRES